MNMDKALDSYLGDHVAGARGGVELAWRTARAQPDHPELRRLAVDIEDDRRELLDIMRQLGVKEHRYKSYAAWFAEKLGRLKTNGSLLRRSPLSDVVEVEALLLGVRGKAALWRTLRLLADDDGRIDPSRLERLAQRATEQIRLLEQRHATAVAALFGLRPASFA